MACHVPTRFRFKSIRPFAVFHRGFAALIVGAGAAFGLARGGDFGDDVIKDRRDVRPRRCRSRRRWCENARFVSSICFAGLRLK